MHTSQREIILARSIEIHYQKGGASLKGTISFHLIAIIFF